MTSLPACLRAVCLLLTAVALSPLHAAFWSRTPDGTLKIAGLSFDIAHIAPGWSSTTLKKLTQDGHLTLQLAEPKPDTLDLDARFHPKNNLETLAMWMITELPVTGSGITLTANGTPVPLPETFDKFQFFIENRCRTFTFSFPGGAALDVTGDFKALVQDNRLHKRKTFSVRFYFPKYTPPAAALALRFTFRSAPRIPLDLAPAAVTLPQPLPVLPTGNLLIGSISLPALPNRTFLTLGNRRPGTFRLDTPKSDRFLMLLHAAQTAPEHAPLPAPFATVAVRYADGSRNTFPLRYGHDLAAFHAPQHLPNARALFKDTTHAPFTGLYCTQIDLGRSDAAEITLTLDAPDNAWLIAGAAFTPAPVVFSDLDDPVFITPSEEWIPLTCNGRIEPGSPLDFSAQLDAPAGKYGRVVRNDAGQMVFRNAPDKRVKFIGTNLCFEACFPTHEQADELADRLARVGFNAIRFHHHDGLLVRKKQGPVINPESLDKLEYFFAALKKRGMYIVTDLYCSRTLSDADQVPEASEIPPQSQKLKLLLPISESARTNLKAFAKNWLTHRNPYTGLTWLEDPALVSVSLVNENNLAQLAGRITGKLKQRYDRAFTDWMAQTRPGTPLGDFHFKKNRFYAEFIYMLQHQYTRNLKNFMKETLGFKGFISDVNMCAEYPLVLIRDDLDDVNSHKYHDHPSFPVNPWRAPFLFRQDSSILNLGSEVPERLLPARLYGKPFSVTEFRFCYANQFRCEEAPLIGAYAALQDWDGLYGFAWAHSLKEALEPVPTGLFNTSCSIHVLLGKKLMMNLLRRGDVRPAENAFACHVPRTYWKTFTEKQFIASGTPFDFPLPFARLGLISRIGTTLSPGTETVLTPEQVADTAPLPFPHIEALRKNLRDNGIAVSDTGEITLDSKSGTLAVITPNTESLTTVVPGPRPFAGNLLELRNTAIPQTVAATSLDQLPLAQSRRILIMHLTNQVNTMALFRTNDLKLLEKAGRLPSLIRRDTPTVALRLGGQTAPKLTALFADGRTAGPARNAAFTDGTLTFTADPAAYPGAICAYLVER